MGGFGKGFLTAILIIAILVCAAAFLWLVIGGPRM